VIPETLPPAWEASLAQLDTMGYSDTPRNRRLLVKHSGNMAKVLASLTRSNLKASASAVSGGNSAEQPSSSVSSTLPSSATTTEPDEADEGEVLDV